MNLSILEERLKKYNITYFDIENEIKKINKEFKKYAIFIYCSQMENLGTENSDFDVYVIFDDNIEVLKKVEFLLNNVAFDVEFISEKNINSLINLIENDNIIDLFDAKLLTRILKSELIYNPLYGNTIKSLLNINKILVSAKKMYEISIHSIKDDFVDFYNSGDYETALVLVRELVFESIGLLNLNNGNYNFKPKWYNRIFLKNNGYKEDLLTRYLELYLYPNFEQRDTKKYIDQLLCLAQDIYNYNYFD